MIADQPLRDLLLALAARTPAPGGGASSAITAALGCATGAMAARYTTGPKWADRAVEAEALAAQLDAWRDRCSQLADADAAAFADAQAARKSGDAVAHTAADARSRQIPAELIRTAADAATALRAFAPRCNQQLVSDIQVGIHLLIGGGRGAWATYLINQPPSHERAVVRRDLGRLEEAEQGG